MKRFCILLLTGLLAACVRSGSSSGILPIPPDAQSTVRDAATGYKTVFSFDGADGAGPDATLLNVKGRLYGTTSSGGDWSTSGGTVFSVTTDGHESVLHSFGQGKDGKSPQADLTMLDGTLFGTTEFGGRYANGTVFSIDASHKEHVLHSFGKGRDGSRPTSGLAVLNGTLYGTTTEGGQSSDGTIFSITPTGIERVIYSFDGSSGGAYSPRAGLTVIGKTLYGTTFEGGCLSSGIVFSVTPPAKEATLYKFSCNSNYNDGEGPDGKLLAIKNTLYGVTFAGGGPYQSEIDGTVFSVTTSGKEQVLHSFGKSGDGVYPEGSLVSVGGTLYGVTIEGGANGKGIVFSATDSGSEHVLYSFGALPDGENPYAGLIDLGGTLYGTTANGGKGRYGGGTVYKIAP